jgi:DNA-binding CsgD family transcriptional regulator
MAPCVTGIRLPSWPLACSIRREVYRAGRTASFGARARDLSRPILMTAEPMARASGSPLGDSDSFSSGGLPRSEVIQLRSVLRILLAQHGGERAESWRRSVLRSLRLLTASDSAMLIIWGVRTPLMYGDEISQELVSSYVNRFAELDRSRALARERGLEVWSLSQVWQPGEWERSIYYRSFAAPHRLHDTVGVTFQLASPRTEVCLLFHRVGPGSPGSSEHRRELLALLLEPIRAGFGLDLGAGDLTPHLSSLIDVTGQALALYGMDGRELGQNPVLRRILSQDHARDTLQDQMRSVAKSVLACVARGSEQSDRSPRHGDGSRRDGTRREVATSQAAYRLRGNLVGRNSLGHGTAVLVSLDRVAFELPAPDSLRGRYGLTVRELQVASLLMHRLTNAEIARMLSISPHTARHHTESVLAKLGVRSREALRRLVTDGVTS